MPYYCIVDVLKVSILFVLLFNANGADKNKNNERSIENASSSFSAASPLLVAGWGESRYVYEPSFLPLPPQANIEHAHAIVIDETDDDTIIITYKDKVDSSKCLLRWRKVTEIAELIGPSNNNDTLCKGVPHGLIIAVEDTQINVDKANRSLLTESSTAGVLYHANNEQALHKTNMNGDIIWTVKGKLKQQSSNGHNSISNRHNTAQRKNNDNDDPYRPTWFASQPKSPYLYLADGYGSSKVYVLNKFHGNYTGHSFGGYGVDHGKFQTCHSISYDWRFNNEMVVCDRENHRLEYFRVDALDPSVFEYSKTISFYPLLQRPCNLRIRPLDGYAIVPFLEGSVGILNRRNDLVDVINITETLGQHGFLHPHDAHFVPGTSGDFIVVTWNPGRIGYFRRVRMEEYEQSSHS